MMWMDKFGFGQIMEVVQWWSKGFVMWWVTSCTSNLAVPHNIEVKASCQMLCSGASFIKWKDKLNQSPTLFLHDLPLIPWSASSIHVLHYISIFKIVLTESMCSRYINNSLCKRKKFSRVKLVNGGLGQVIR